MNILQADQNVLSTLNDFFIGHSPIVDQFFKFISVYLIYSLPVILALMWFLIKDNKKRISLVMSMVSVILSVFVFTKAISHIWYRPRPDLSVVGLKEVFFHRPDFSFPSDHASALFALTFTLYYFGYKKAANWFLVYSIIITFGRVVIGVHYPLDIIGGATVAFIGSTIIWLLRKPLERYLYNPIVKLLKIIKLA